MKREVFEGAVVSDVFYVLPTLFVDWMKSGIILPVKIHRDDSMFPTHLEIEYGRDPNPGIIKIQLSESVVYQQVCAVDFQKLLREEMIHDIGKA